MIVRTPASRAASYGGRYCAAQQRLVHGGVTLVDDEPFRRRRAPHGRAVADVVLGRGQHVRRSAERLAAVRALQPVDVRRAQAGHDLGVLAVALVGPAPPDVVGHGDDRREVPGDARGGDLDGGGRADAADELGVVGGAEPDVVREDRGAVDRAVAVDGVDAVGDRDRQPGRHRRPLVAVDHRRPRRDVVGLGRAPAAAEHGADEPPLDVRRGDVGAVDHRHLADLLGQRHPRQQVLDAVRHRVVGVDRAHRMLGRCRRNLRRRHGGCRRRASGGCRHARRCRAGCRRRRRLVAAGDRHDRRRHDAQHDSRRCGTPGTLDRRLRASAGSRSALRRRGGRARRALRRLARTSPPSVPAGAAGSIRTRCLDVSCLDEVPDVRPSRRLPTAPRRPPVLRPPRRQRGGADGQWVTVTRRPRCRSSPGGSRRSRRSCRLPRVR